MCVDMSPSRKENKLLFLLPPLDHILECKTQNMIINPANRPITIGKDTTSS